MDQVKAVLNWFTGGSHNYMTLYHCMDNDVLWISITVILDFTVAAGYVLIAKHWWANQQILPPGEPRQALARMRNIFILCGLCGYLFIPVKMVWPAWRLYDIFMVFLVYVTWRYAWGAKDLKVVYREINRSHQLSQELDAARAESKRKSFFLNAISHDLKNPLHGLTLQAELAQLQVSGGDPQAANEAISRIQTCAHEMGNLLNGFLELGRLDWVQDPLSTTTFDVSEVVKEVVKAQDAAARSKGLRLVADVPGQLQLHTDRAKLERILSNLVSNAIKYTDAGQVTVRLGSTNEQVVVEVADTGRGIAPDQQEQIWDEFYQVQNHAREHGQGHGLGLAIARRLAERIEGRLELESESGRGSKFRLILERSRAIESPDAEPAALAGTDAGPRAAASAGG